MSLTININGLTLCHRGSGGVTHNTLPDVCKTPDKGIPKPFDNEAYSKDLANGTTTVFADGGNMIGNFGSIFAKSSLDAGGMLMGIKSGTVLAEADFITHSFDVFFEGKPACRLTDKMWMNHRNTVNMSGLLQPHLSGYTGTNPIMKAACEVFCTVRKEGIDAKAKNPPVERFDYSKRARELSDNHPNLMNSVKTERTFLHATQAWDPVHKVGSLGDKAAKLAGRVPLALDAIKSRLVKAAMQKAGVQVATRAAKKVFLKFIPGINVLSTAWDVYDIASTGYEILKGVEGMLAAYDPLKVNTYEIRPDMATIDPVTQKPTAIYDYKFDRPAMTDGNGKELTRYQDDWQRNGQKEFYDEAVGQNNVHEVNEKQCKCK